MKSFDSENDADGHALKLNVAFLLLVGHDWQL